MDDKELIKAILHYQQCLDKYTRRNDEARVLYCLSKLYKMPVSIGHLQETGVGRTVNALRKHNGGIGEAAKALVSKWKEMVAADSEDNDAKETSKSETTKHNDKHKTHREKSGSSHRESDKKKSRSNSTSEEDSKPNSKKVKEDPKHRHHDSNDTRRNKDKHEKHKSSKRKRDTSDESDESESDYETRNDKSSDHSKSSSEERVVKTEKKSKHSKRESGEPYDENQEYKRKKYSESDESDEELELNEKKQFHKSSRHHHEKKEKPKHEHKKEKKESSNESRAKKDDAKPKEKHSSSSSSGTSKSVSKSDKRDKGRESKSDKKSKRSSSKSRDHSKKSKKSSPDKVTQSRTMGENGIGSGSGASFAEALGMLMPSSSKASKKKIAVIHPLNVDKPSAQSRDSSPDLVPSKIPELLSPKKLTPLDIKVDNLLPEITPNYRPLGFPIDNGMFKNKLSSEDETLSAIMYNKISRTKVFSGNKVAWGKVPSLFEICTRVLQDNIDALEYTGGVPYLILKPVIERANPDQLFMLEHHNPYLIEDTDELWQLHCNKEFRTKKREEMETWRDMYMRCLDEREAKLRALTANIKQSQDKSLPVRQTKLAYVDSFVKPPRNVARKQAKHGTGGVDKKPVVTPSSRLNALATSGAAGQISVPNPGTRAVSSSGSSTAVVKPKKAPLMQKTLALMKNRIFRR